jgi:hypothetical protein
MGDTNMTNFVIELWDMDTHHPFLATDPYGKVIEFPRDKQDEAKAKALEVIDELAQQSDREWMYFVTDHPSQFAVPLK